MRLYILLFDFCERLKFPSGNPLSRIKFIKALPYFWYLFISWVENLIVSRIGLKNAVLNKSKRDETIIASLTTYPARIETVDLTIMTIFMQTIRPDRVVLWLAEEQFPERKLPQKLTLLQNQGLEIKFCKDYRSHKKYYLALQEQKEAELVITFDDDILYDPHTIERAVQKHRDNPRAVVVNQAMIPIINNDGSIAPYSIWSEANSKNNHNQLLSPLTGSGCLYPYSALTSKAFDWDAIENGAKSTDDLWIFFQCVLARTPILLTTPRSKTFTVVKGSQTSNLSQQNCIGDGNDRNLIILRQLFPEVERIIKRQHNAEPSSFYNYPNL